jgi:hypothetical protein
MRTHWMRESLVTHWFQVVWVSAYHLQALDKQLRTFVFESKNTS